MQTMSSVKKKLILKYSFLYIIDEKVSKELSQTVLAKSAQDTSDTATLTWA